MKIIDCSKIVDICRQYEREINPVTDNETADFLREYYNYKISIEIHRLIRESKIEIDIDCPFITLQEQEAISNELVKVFEKFNKVPCSIFIKEIANENY